MGLRETAKLLDLGKIKGVLVAPDIERVEEQGFAPSPITSHIQGGLDDAVARVLDLAQGADVPIVVTMNRRQLGRAIGRSVRVSVVGIINFDGANDEFKATA